MEYFLKEPLTPEKATELINEIANYSDCTIDLTDHCSKRMQERGFFFRDLIILLSNGAVRTPAEYDERHEHYKYKVEGPTLDDDTAFAITVILGPRSLRIVSIF